MAVTVDGMAGKVQPTTRIDEDLWDRFREDVRARKGGLRGHLPTELENAIREYLNATEGGDTHDRLCRLEQRMDDVLDAVGGREGDEGSAAQAKKKKESDVSQTVMNRLSAIEGEIAQEAQESAVVHQTVINTAIENHAGASAPTLRRYKELLKTRHIAFQHPDGTSASWFLDVEPWVRLVERDFDHRNDDIAREYGRDWYDQMIDQVFSDESTGPAFQ